MFERRHQRLLARSQFAARLGWSTFYAALLLGGSLALGTVGYRLCEGLGWLDALLNASMILTGMGPVTPLQHDRAKIFASAYAIFSGVVFLAGMGLLAAPILHRFLHRFHLDEEEPNR